MSTFQHLSICLPTDFALETSAIETIVRFVFVTSLVSLFVICLGLSAAVWGRRNKIHLRPLTGLILALASCGALVVAFVALRHATTSHDGIVEAGDLFTIRSKSDAIATVLVATGAVQRGDPLVRFEVPGLDGRLASLDSRIMTLREQLQLTALQPLQLDAAITVRKGLLSDDLARRQSLIVDMMKSSRENRRTLLDTEVQFADRLGHIDLQIDSSKQISHIATSQLVITQDALNRAQYLRQQGIESVTASENRLTDRLSSELTLNKAASDIASLERMRAEMQKMHASATSLLSAAQTEIDDQIDEQRKDIATLNSSLVDTVRDEALDHKRAEEALRHGREALNYEIVAIEAEKRALLATTTVQAPESGTIIYRNSAPGIVSDNSLLVALAPASGFSAHVRMGSDEVAALDKGRSAVFELIDANLLTRYVPGFYRATSAAPFESDESIVTFDVSLPTELIERLARSAEPIGVRLIWNAPLSGDPLFRSGLTLMAGALMLSVATFRRFSAAGGNAIGVVRVLLPLLWLCQPTEAIASGSDDLGLSICGVLEYAPVPIKSSGKPCDRL